MGFFTPSSVPKESGFCLKLGSESFVPLEKLPRPDDGSWGGWGRHRTNALLRNVNRICNKPLRSKNLDQCWEGLIRMEKRLESYQQQADELEQDFFEPLFIPSRIWVRALPVSSRTTAPFRKRIIRWGRGSSRSAKSGRSSRELSSLVQDYKLIVEKRMEALRKAHKSVMDVSTWHHRSKANKRALSALTAREVRKARKLLKALRRNVNPNSSPEERRLAVESIRSLLGVCPERSVALRSLAVITGYKREKNQKLDCLAVLQHAARECFFSKGKKDAYKAFFRQKRTCSSLKRDLDAKYQEWDTRGLAVPAVP